MTFVLARPASLGCDSILKFSIDSFRTHTMGFFAVFEFHYMQRQRFLALSAIVYAVSK